MPSHCPAETNCDLEGAGSDVLQRQSWELRLPPALPPHDSLVAKSCPTFATPWTVARQAPLSMGFSRPEYWSGSPFPSSEDLPDPGIEPGSPTLQADDLATEL